MNIEQVTELKKLYSLPQVMYYVYLNEQFKKVYTMDDIEKPEKMLYDFSMQDYMTLGRPMPEYEDWAQAYMERELERKQRSAECLLTLGKIGITSFDDIETFFKENCDNLEFQYFADDKLNDYFEIKK